MFRSIWLLMLALLMIQQVNAATFTDELKIGDRHDIETRSFALKAGSHKFSIVDAFAGSSQKMASAQAFLVSGDRLLASVDLSRLNASFNLAADTEATLYVAGKPASVHGLLLTRLERTGAAAPLLDEPFLFSKASEPLRTYEFEQTYILSKTAPITLDLTDFSASGMLPLTPFSSLLVLMTHRGDDGRFTYFYSDAASLEGGPELSHTIALSPGNLFIEIVALAPDTGISQLGWSLKQDAVELAGEVFQIDDNASEPGVVVGEFNLAEPSVIDASAAILSQQASDFSVAIASASNDDVVELSRQDLQVTSSLAAGRYKVLLLKDDNGSGLVGIEIKSGAATLLATPVSLGDYKPLGELKLAAATNVDAGLHFFLLPAGLAGMDVLVANSQSTALALNLSSMTQSGVSMAAGDYSVWVRSVAVSGEGYYRVHVQPQGGTTTQWWGALGGGLIESTTFTVPNATKGSLRARNFNLPDALSEEAILLLAQGDSALAQFSIDPADNSLIATDIALPAGEVQLAVIGRQGAGKATVLGYAMETTDTAGGTTTPPRSVNGSGGGGGGGSFSSFILYCLLVFKILSARYRARAQ